MVSRKRRDDKSLPRRSARDSANLSIGFQEDAIPYPIATRVKWKLMGVTELKKNIYDKPIRSRYMVLSFIANGSKVASNRKFKMDEF